MKNQPNNLCNKPGCITQIPDDAVLCTYHQQGNMTWDEQMRAINLERHA